MKNKENCVNTEFRSLNEVWRKSGIIEKELTGCDLMKMGVLDKNGIITESGKLFSDFAAENSIIIELDRWHGFDKSWLIQRKRIQGSIFYDILEATLFLKDHILAYKCNYAGGCRVHFCYPFEAAERCLLISFMKKDLCRSDPIQIDIFQNRMEICFSCVQKEAVNQEIETVFKYCFKNSGYRDSLAVIDESYRKENKSWRIEEKDRVMKIILENIYYQPIEKDFFKSLRPSAKRCYSMIKKYPGRQIKELSERLNRPYITVQTEIRNLRKKQLVERRGDLKTGGYFCIEIEDK